MTGVCVASFRPPRLRLGEGERAGVASARRRGDDEEAIFFRTAMARLDRLILEHRHRHRHVLVASFPKSASTYLNEALVRATGFRPYLLNTWGHDTERNIVPQSIPMFLARDTVSQEHMRATTANVAFLQKLALRPVVLVRNIFDAIVSACDHSRREPGRGPAGHVPPAFPAWTRTQQLWFSVRMATPWLLNILTSWQEAQETLPLLWITYEELVGDPVRTVRRILDHSEVEVPDDRIASSLEGIDLGRVRFNRGLAGRGRRELSPEQCRVVESIAALQAGTRDLSPIGL